MGPFTCTSCGAEVAREDLDCTACGKSLVPDSYWKHRSHWMSPFLRLPKAPDAEVCDYAGSVMRGEGWLNIVLNGFLASLLALFWWFISASLRKLEVWEPGLRARLQEADVPSDIRESYTTLLGSLRDTLDDLRPLLLALVVIALVGVFFEFRNMMVARRLLTIIQDFREKPGPTPPGPAPRG